jgi:DNA-binding response OmpR family regulator
MSRILVIDDERDVRAMISIVLRVNHFEVVEAASAAAGLKAFAESLFDVAIVDIFLGDSNGFDLIAALRERVPRLPVVAVSGMTVLDGMSQSAEFSDVQRLQKPFRPNQLIAAIEAARGLIRQTADAVVAANG